MLFISWYSMYRTLKHLCVEKFVACTGSWTVIQLNLTLIKFVKFLRNPWTYYCCYSHFTFIRWSKLCDLNMTFIFSGTHVPNSYYLDQYQNQDLEKLVYSCKKFRRNYAPIPNFNEGLTKPPLRLLGMDEQVHPMALYGCNYVSMP